MTKAIEKMRSKKCEIIKEAKGGDTIQARRRHGAASAENDCPLPSSFSSLLLPFRFLPSSPPPLSEGGVVGGESGGGGGGESLIKDREES